LLRGGEGGSVGFTPEEAKLKEERGWVGFTLIFARFEVSRGGQAQGGDGDAFVLVRFSRHSSSHPFGDKHRSATDGFQGGPPKEAKLKERRGG